ncbi:MAG TPA: tetratricopeptide repeat protein [Pirellulales bacterium]|nr:tetratricopeptide repeat protein [Pirellulales bacterium]
MLAITKAQFRRKRLSLVAAVIAMLAVCATASLWAAREWQFHRHLRAGQLAIKRFAADEAVVELTAAETLKPLSAEVQYLLGVADRKARRLDDCPTYLDKALELGWPADEIRFQKLLLAFQAGDHRAEPVIRRITSLPMADDMAEDAYEALTIGYLSEYRMVEAGRATDDWLRLRPRSVRAMLLRAEIFGVTERSKEQLKQYEQVLAIEPDSYAAHLGMARNLLEAHDVERALEEYRWCSERSTDDFSPPLGMAACYQHQGELEKAADVLRELLKRCLPHDQRAQAAGELGKLLRQTGALAEAISLLSESVELNPYDEQIEYTLAMSLVKIGKLDEAQRHHNHSKELEKLKLQVHDIKTVIFNQPDDAQPRYEAGLLLAKLGKPKIAAAMMLGALRCDPRHSGARAELAKYYHEIGRDDLAREYEASTVEVAGAAAAGERGGGF